MDMPQLHHEGGTYRGPQIILQLYETELNLPNANGMHQGRPLVHPSEPTNHLHPRTWKYTCPFHWCCSGSMGHPQVALFNQRPGGAPLDRFTTKLLPSWSQKQQNTQWQTIYSKAHLKYLEDLQHYVEQPKRHTAHFPIWNHYCSAQTTAPVLFQTPWVRKPGWYGPLPPMTVLTPPETTFHHTLLVPISYSRNESTPGP